MTQWIRGSPLVWGQFMFELLNSWFTYSKNFYAISANIFSYISFVNLTIDIFLLTFTFLKDNRWNILSCILYVILYPQLNFHWVDDHFWLLKQNSQLSEATMSSSNMKPVKWVWALKLSNKYAPDEIWIISIQTWSSFSKFSVDWTVNGLLWPATVFASSTQPDPK